MAFITKKRISITLTLLVLAGLGYGYHLYQKKNKPVFTGYVTAKVKQGDFVVTINDSGVLKAQKNALVMVPEIEGMWNQMKISKLVPEGTRVKKGDPVVWFDMTQLQDQVKQLEFQMTQEKGQLEQSLERLRLSKQNRSRTMKERKIDWDIARLEYEQNSTKFAKIQRLVNEEILPQKEYEDWVMKNRSSRLRVEQAEKEYLKAAEQQASDERTTEIDIKRTEQRFKSQEERYNTMKKNMEAGTLFAPTDGIAIIQKNWRGRQMQTLKEGDTLWPGNGVVSIPDLSQMQVMTQVNETDLSKVTTGLKLRATMDSIPDLVLTGIVTQVGTLAMERERSAGSGQVSTEESAGIKVFEITVDLDKSYPRLRPGMTCKTEMILETIPNALSIPIKAVQMNNGNTTVKVLNPKTRLPEVKTVTLGKRSAQNVQVLRGLKAGEEVILPEEE